MLLLRPKMLEDRPSEPSTLEVVLPRTAGGLDEATWLVDVPGVAASPVDGKVNWSGDDELGACSCGNVYVDDGTVGLRIVEA